MVQLCAPTSGNGASTGKATSSLTKSGQNKDYPPLPKTKKV